MTNAEKQRKRLYQSSAHGMALRRRYRLGLGRPAFRKRNLARRSRRQTESLKTSTLKYSRWSDSDEVFALRTDKTIAQIAAALGRTWEAVIARRKMLRRVNSEAVKETYG